MLDDATQRAIQNGQAKLNAYVPIAPQFDLRERRDVGRVDMVATPKPNLDVTASFTTQKHGGELPWGASFGFSNDVEVPLPYESRTNDFTIGTEWTNARNMLRVAYSGSWFDNLAPTLTWDSPLRLDDASGAPGRGRMSLWPSNSAQTISFGGYTKLAHKTQVTGFFSYGVLEQRRAAAALHDQLGAAADRAAPREHRGGSARLLDQPEPHLAPVDRLAVQRARAQLHLQQPHARDVDHATWSATTPRCRRRQRAVQTSTRTAGRTFDGDATWTRLMPFAVTVGYSHNGNGYDARIFESSGENVFRVSADAVGTSWLTFRTQYEFGDRTGSGLDETQLTAIGEHPEMRHYDLADRTRNRFTGPGRHRAVGRLDVQRVRRHPQGRLQQQLLRPAGFDRPHLLARARISISRTAWAPARPTTTSATPGCSGRTKAIRRRRSSTIRCATGPPIRPRRCTISRSTPTRHASAATPKCASRTTSATPRGTTSTRSRRAARYRRPISCPTCSTSCSSCTSTCATGCRSRLAASFSYLYEPLSIYDFAFDPSVVNGIVQPSSLVMGYVYRPYTAHSAVFGIRYFW